MMKYKRTVKENDGTLYVNYQQNGWIRYYKEYNDGTTEEWFDKE